MVYIGEKDILKWVQCCTRIKLLCWVQHSLRHSAATNVGALLPQMCITFSLKQDLYGQHKEFLNCLINTTV